MGKGVSLIAPEEHRDLFARLADAEAMLEEFRRALPPLSPDPVRVTGCRVDVARSRSSLRLGRLRVIYTLTVEPGDGPARTYVLVATAPESRDYLTPELLERCRRTVGHPRVVPFTTLAGYVEPLRLAFHFFPVDLYLPALRELTGPDAGALLEPWLPECRDGGARIERLEAEVVKYRPAHRCVLRIEMTLRRQRAEGEGDTSRRAVYVKLLENPSRARRGAHLRSVWEALHGGSGALTLPEPLGFDPARGMLISEAVDAERCLTEWIGCLEKGRALPEGVDLDRLERCMIAAADGLCDLQSCGVILPAERTFAGAVAGLREDLDWLKTARPELISEVRAVVDRLEDPSEAGRLVPGHGAFSHKQMLGDETGLTLIDWDDMAMAPSALDASDFLSRLRKRSIGPGGPNEALEHLAGVFRQRFLGRSSAAAEPGLARSLARFEAASLCEKALRSFRRPGTAEGAVTEVRANVAAARDLLG